VSDIEIKQKRFRERLKKLIPRIINATIVTAIVGAILLVIWFLVLRFLVDYPDYQLRFAFLAWATLFFTFAIRVAEGTFYKFGFIIGRAFFLIIYVIYVSNGGVLIIDQEGFHFVIEFIPILGLMILINLLDLAKGVLQALEFTSASPTD